MPSLEEILTGGLTTDPHPVYPGAVALLSIAGTTTGPVIVGHATRYADDSAPLPDPVPMRADTIFDIASLTKLFTATAILTLVADGTLELDRPVAETFTTYATGDRAGVTLRHLLNHTSGLPAHARLWTQPFLADRVDAVLRMPLEAPPGTRHEYSCLGYITAGWIAERATGRSLPELIADRVIRPLGLTETGFGPGVDLRDRIAATEFEPYAGRGMVRGSVHDENSWSLGGTTGNAGLFSTAADLLRFGEFLAGDGAPVLEPAAFAELIGDQLPAGVDPGYGQGIGPRIGDRSFMGPLADSGALGHTGFTGTSLVVDRTRSLVVVLLTNRVHPRRDWSELNTTRRAVAEYADHLASSVAVG
jgi:CubicO group peptidase (beta-lactamase class C family)